MDKIMYEPPASEIAALIAEARILNNSGSFEEKGILDDRSDESWW